MAIQRDEQNMANAGNPENVNINDSSSFKYKSSFLKGFTTRDIAANVNLDIANVHIDYLLMKKLLFH